MKSDSKRTSCSVFPDGSSLPVRTGAVHGVVKVHESVVCSIIRKAACSVPGVAHLAGNSLIDNIAEFVGTSRSADRAISLEMGAFLTLGAFTFFCLGLGGSETSP